MTPKQERFAMAYIATGNASEAYRRAYDAGRMKDATINRTAKELLDHPKITARIAELQSKARADHDITIEKLTGMALATYRQATDLDMPSAAISAVMGLAKLHGLTVDKANVKVDATHHVTKEPMSDLEIARRIAFILSRADHKMKAPGA